MKLVMLDKFEGKYLKPEKIKFNKYHRSFKQNSCKTQYFPRNKLKLNILKLKTTKFNIYYRFFQGI